MIEALTLKQPLDRVEVGIDYATLRCDTPEEDGGGKKRFEEVEERRRRWKSVAIGTPNPVAPLGCAGREKPQGDIYIECLAYREFLRMDSYFDTFLCFRTC